MALEDIKKLIEENKDNQEVQNYIQGLVALTPDRVEKFLEENEEGKKLLQPRLDKYFTKGLETWKQKTLPTIVDEEVKKRVPDETPEAKRLRELEEKLTNIEKSRVKAELKSLAIKQASEKGLPTDLVEYLVADDEETTIKNLNSVIESFNKAVEEKVKARFKENGREPQEPSNEPVSDISRMSMPEFIEYRRKQGIK